MKIIFATHNPYKVEEMQSAIGNAFEIISLKEAGIEDEIPEPFETLEKNASQKSKTIFQITGQNCFSEDTGLEVEALDGEPGVKSARFAGNEKSFDRNIDKLLGKLANISNLNARFRTILSLIWEGKEYLFEGVTEGTITRDKKGGYGFGYDPIFIPQGSKRTFAEMSLVEKNKYSHRKKAADKLVLFLQDSVKALQIT